jgi:hypothetical protein
VEISQGGFPLSSMVLEEKLKKKINEFLEEVVMRETS